MYVVVSTLASQITPVYNVLFRLFSHYGTEWRFLEYVGSASLFFLSGYFNLHLTQAKQRFVVFCFVREYVLVWACVQLYYMCVRICNCVRMCIIFVHMYVYMWVYSSFPRCFVCVSANKNHMFHTLHTPCLHLNHHSFISPQELLQQQWKLLFATVMLCTLVRVWHAIIYQYLQMFIV